MREGWNKEERASRENDMNVETLQGSIATNVAKGLKCTGYRVLVCGPVPNFSTYNINLGPGSGINHLITAHTYTYTLPLKVCLSKS